MAPIVAGYRGPERRCAALALSAAAGGARWLAAMLDEIDYGMVLVSEDAEIVHANHAARKELDAGHPLQRLGRRLCARLAG
ncbi:MAG: hypothetical protein KGL43_05265, partial [Burkholderiales bacterium]|nr:hypothetical protein [Burkholderiales bacterium]